MRAAFCELAFYNRRSEIYLEGICLNRFTLSEVAFDCAGPRKVVDRERGIKFAEKKNNINKLFILFVFAQTGV